MKVGESRKLSGLQKAMLAIGLKVYVGHEQGEGWKEPLPVYVFNCQKHGRQEAYPSGWAQNIYCPLCQQEQANHIKQRQRS